MSEEEVKDTVSDEDKENSAEPLSEVLDESAVEASEETPVTETPVSQSEDKDVVASENSLTEEKKEFFIKAIP